MLENKIYKYELIWKKYIDHIEDIAIYIYLVNNTLSNEIYYQLLPEYCDLNLKSTCKQDHEFHYFDIDFSKEIQKYESNLTLRRFLNGGSL